MRIVNVQRIRNYYIKLISTKNTHKINTKRLLNTKICIKIFKTILSSIKKNFTAKLQNIKKYN